MDTVKGNIFGLNKILCVLKFYEHIIGYLSANNKYSGRLSPINKITGKLSSAYNIKGKIG